MWIRDLQLTDERARPHPHISSELDIFAVQVVDLYLRGLRRKVKTRGTAKVLIELHPCDRLTIASMYKGAPASPITLVRWPFYFDSLDLVVKAEQKRVVLDAVHAAVGYAATTLGWDRQPFEDARQGVIDAGFVLSGWLLPSRSWSPDRNAAVDFPYEFTDDAIPVSAVQFGRDRTEVARVPLLHTTPFATLKRLITHVAWVGDSRINVRSQAFSGTTRMIVRLGPPMTSEHVG